MRHDHTEAYIVTSSLESYYILHGNTGDLVKHVGIFFRKVGYSTYDPPPQLF
jgi:hypothetical protein